MSVIMAPQYVRGDKIIAVSNPPACVAQEFYVPVQGPSWGLVRGGDKLTVSKRIRGGWLRVKNSRNGRVTNVRVGPWLARESDVQVAVNCGGQGSEIDLMIRKCQNEGLRNNLRESEIKNKTLEGEIVKMNEEYESLEREARVRLEAKDEQIEELESKLGCRMAQIENMEEMIEELKRENAELKKMFWSPPATNENMKVRSEMYNLVG